MIGFFRNVFWSLAIVSFCILTVFSVQRNLISITYADDSMLTKDFTLDVNNLTPSNVKYDSSPKDNIKEFLQKVTKILLVVIPTLAVLFMVIGGIKIILAGGKTEDVNKGKTIITYNIIAVSLALLSYAIIELIAWLLGSTV